MNFIYNVTLKLNLGFTPCLPYNVKLMGSIVQIIGLYSSLVLKAKAMPNSKNTSMQLYLGTCGLPGVSC